MVTASDAGLIELTDEQKAVVETVRDFVENEVIPVADELEHRDEFPEKIVEGMKELGLFGLTVPDEYGGAGLDLMTYALAGVELSRGWMSLSGILNTHFLAVYLLKQYGSEEQRQRWLPRMATGELRAALSMSEPGAGSDVQAIQCRAVREGDSYVVNGTKMWVTNGLRAGLVVLLCKTDPEADPPHKGMSVLMVEKEPEAQKFEGITIPPNIEKMGYHGVETTELAFEEAIAYAQERQAFGKPIAQHQMIQEKLAHMGTLLEASKLMLMNAAKKKSEGERSDLEAGMAKYFCTEACHEIVTEALRVHGGYGYSAEYTIERLYRDAPFLLIGEGTSEIQKLVISRQLLERYRVEG